MTITTFLSGSIFEHGKKFICSWKFFFLALTLLTGAGIAMITNSSGLDASWWMLTVNATRYGLIQKSEFIGTYGPLGFLDFALVTWKIGLFLNLIWKIFITTWLFFSIWSAITQKTKSSSFKVGILTTLFVSAINYFLPPSQSLIVIILLLFVAENSGDSKSKQLGNLKIILLSGITAITFLVKFFPFTLALSLSFTLILHSYCKNKHTFFHLIQVILKYLSGLVTLVMGILILLGFNLDEIVSWLHASSQMTLGYKAMSWEDPGRWWEYIAFLTLIFPLLLFVRKVFKPQLLIIPYIAFFYFLFLYGFNRHDSHAIVAFSFLAIIYFLHAIYRNNSRIYVSAAFSLIVLLAVSGFSLSQFFDFSTRIQSSISYIKAIDPRYAQQIVAGNIQYLQNTYPMSRRILDEVRDDTVSIYPWDQLAANAWGLNLVSPPAPQLITAYTPWLDKKNVDWVNSSKASQFMLWSQPKSVDYRYPHWDSPAFQVATVCNYEHIAEDENWILLERRPKSICGTLEKEFEITSTDTLQKKFRIVTKENKITIMRIEVEQSNLEDFQRSIFKPIRSDSVFIDGIRARLVWATKQNLIVAVPDGVNYPAPYDFKRIQDIELKSSARVFLTEIPINSLTLTRSK